MAPSSVLTMSVASASVLSAGTPISASAALIGRRQVANAAAAAALVDSAVQSTVAAAIGQPELNPMVPNSSVHWRTIAANSPLGDGCDMAPRNRAMRPLA